VTMPVDALETAIQTLDLAAEHIGDAEGNGDYRDEYRALAAQIAQARALTAIGVLLGILVERHAPVVRVNSGAWGPG
jgi:hypothetical protein